jgi:hypothetical protein
MIGPGKYDGICTVARETAGAEAAIVIIINGNKGSGFSVQGDPAAVVSVEQVIHLIRAVADEMERDLPELKNRPG